MPHLYIFTADGVLFANAHGEVRVAVDGHVRSSPVIACEVLDAPGCGVLGLAVDAHYADTGHVYVFYTASTGYNRVSRFALDRRAMVAVTERVLLDTIPASDAGRNGGAMIAGPDDRLYVGTGDAGQPALSRSLSSTAGKLLRLSPDGDTCEIWVSGLRDPQSLRLTDDGRVEVCDVDPAGDERIVAAHLNLRIYESAN